MRGQNFILFLEETEEEYFISDKLAKLYVNRFLIDEEAQNEMIYSINLKKKSSRLIHNYDPNYSESEFERNSKGSSDYHTIAHTLNAAKQIPVTNLHLVFGSSFYTINFYRDIKKWLKDMVTAFQFSSITLTLLEGKRFYLISKEKILDAYKGKIGIERNSIIQTIAGLLVTRTSGEIQMDNSQQAEGIYWATLKNLRENFDGGKWLIPPDVFGNKLEMNKLDDPSKTSVLDDVVSANDDIELEFQKSLQQPVGEDTAKVLFHTPMLNQTEMNLIASKNVAYMRKFFQYSPIQENIFGQANNPDADVMEMEKSEACSKFVLCVCNRRTIIISSD